MRGARARSRPRWQGADLRAPEIDYTNQREQETMNRQTNLRWNLIFLLAVLGLARPLLSITGVYSSLGGSTWAPALVTVMIAAVWVGIAVAACSSSPLATLTLAGALYGVLAIVLQQIIWNLVLGGAPEGTPSTAPVLVMSWVSILVTNTVWARFWVSWRQGFAACFRGATPRLRRVA